MDTSSLQPQSQGQLPAWQLDAARDGTRIALELLGATCLPGLVVLEGPVSSMAPHREVDLSATWESGGAAPATPQIGAHDQATVYISAGAVLDPDYIGTATPTRAQSVNALRFAAGYQAAQWALDVDPEAGLRLPPTFTEWGCAEDIDGYSAVATALASMASGFTLIAPLGHQSEDETRAKTAGLFLDILVEIVRDEGFAAIWRGAVGKAVHRFIRNMRIGPDPDSYPFFGPTIRRPSDFLHLVAYAAGNAPWPYDMCMADAA